MTRLLLLLGWLHFLTSCGQAEKPGSTEEAPSDRKAREWIYATQGYRSNDGRQFFIFPPHMPSDLIVTGDSILQFMEDSLNVKQSYNTAKWLTYCYACFDTVKYTDYAVARYGVPGYRLVNELDLTLSEIDRHGHSPPSAEGFDYTLVLTIRDTFVYSSQTIIMPAYPDYYQEFLFYDLFFFRDSQTVIAGFGKEGGSFGVYNLTWLYEVGWEKHFYEKTCPVAHAIDVFRNPFQPEIIRYVRMHEKEIHPWFAAEARKRGMFDSIRYSPEWIDAQIKINKQKPCKCVPLNADTLHN